MNSKDAFTQLAEALMGDAFKAIIARIEGRPYKKTVIMPPTRYGLYKVKVSFTYRHTDQDVNNDTYHLNTNEIIRLRADTDPIYFLHDRSKLEFLGYIKVYR